MKSKSALSRKRRAVDGIGKTPGGKYAKVWPDMQNHNLQELRPAPGTNLNRDRDVVITNMVEEELEKLEALISAFSAKDL